MVTGAAVDIHSPVRSLLLFLVPFFKCLLQGVFSGVFGKLCKVLDDRVLYKREASAALLTPNTEQMEKLVASMSPILSKAKAARYDDNL